MDGSGSRGGASGAGRVLWVALMAGLLAPAAAAEPPDAHQALLARARALELATPYVPPPGDPMEHYASGYAKILCSSVFISGLDPDFAAENVGYFTAPYEVRRQLGNPRIDRAKRSVSVTMPNGTVRTALQVGSQGCVTLPVGKSQVFFTPSVVAAALPDPATQPWPMGDALPGTPLPAGLDRARLDSAVDDAFDPAAMTAAVVVTYQGRIIAERYAPGISASTPLESWSMGKSLAGTLLGVLMQQGAYTLYQPAPIPEWQTPGDPRAAIRIADILHMSSGLRIRAPLDPDYDKNGPYADHYYLYTGSVDSFHYAATRPLQWPPNTVGRYRNTDPVLTNYLVRLAVEKRGQDYHSFPQRALFDKLGIRHMVLDTDPYGNFLTQGYEQGSARDWARIANLYLQDGVWNSERLLPPGYVDFVRTVAPAWQADGRPIYGGLFWVNGDDTFPAPRNLFYMAGVGGQYVLILPERQLAIVRLGYYKGEAAADAALGKAVKGILDALPPAAQ